MFMDFLSCLEIGQNGGVRRERATEYYCLTRVGCQSETAPSAAVRRRSGGASSQAGCPNVRTAATIANFPAFRERGNPNRKRAASKQGRAAAGRAAGSDRPAGGSDREKSWEYASPGGALVIARHRPAGGGRPCRRHRRRASSRKQQEGRDNDKNAAGHARVRAGRPGRRSRASRCRAGCRCPGTMQPVRQATVKAKVSGDVRADHRARGRRRAGGPDARARGHRRPRGEAHRAPGPARVGEGAAGARREDAVDQPEAPQAELHLADRVRQLRVEHERLARQREVGGGAGAPRAERAQGRGRDGAADAASSPSATCSRARRSPSTRRSSRWST